MSAYKENKQRKIIHIDMDCFFAAIEMRENPTLINKPISVGGLPGSRGVVATCNYAARQFGVRSAMPINKALQLCPDLVCLPVRMALYKSVSLRIKSIFLQYSDIIEPLSLDEAYIDVSDSPHCHGSATLIAEEIRKKIYESEGITASAGVAPNKFLAKIASDWNKPNGIFVIQPHDLATFIEHLPVNKINGVGKVTQQKLENLGINTCADIQQKGQRFLTNHLGKFGQRLFELAQGIDTREVKTQRIRKSLSVEDTFPTDLRSYAECQKKIALLHQELQRRLHRLNKQNYDDIQGIFVKIRFSDFTTKTIQSNSQTTDIIGFISLMNNAFTDGFSPVRLLGVGVFFVDQNFPVQLNFRF